MERWSESSLESETDRSVSADESVSENDFMDIDYTEQDPEESGNGRISLFLIRHGHAQHNLGFENIGERAYYAKKYVFSPLTDKGIEQARKLHRRMRIYHASFDEIFSSPLDRAIQTAQILFPNNGARNRHNVQVIEDIRENNYAHTPNRRRTVSELANLYPGFDYSQITHDDDILYRYGDTFNRHASLLARLKDIRSNYHDTVIPKVVLVSHESFLVEFATSYLGTDMKAIGNCEAIQIDIDLNKIE